MASIGPRQPFFRRGIWWESEYQYRQALAREKGFPTRHARTKAIAAQRRLVNQHATNLTREQRGLLAAGLADWQHRIGPHIEGLPVAQRGSNRLPPEILNLMKAAGDGAYPLWRVLYQ